LRDAIVLENERQEKNKNGSEMQCHHIEKGRRIKRKKHWKERVNLPLCTPSKHLGAAEV